MRIKIKAKPGSRSNEIKKLDEDYYEVRVTAPPEKGKANEKVIELMAEYLGVPKSRISILKGHMYKEKILEIN